MQKLLATIGALALAASLTAPALAKHDKTHGSSMNSSSMGKTMSSQCAPGKSWVKGYTTKTGKKVKGYCR